MTAYTQHNAAVTRSEHARHERAKSAPIVGVLHSLASEVVLEVPTTVTLMIWQTAAGVGDADIICAYTSPADNDRDERNLVTDDRTARDIGLQVIKRRPTSARILKESFALNTVRRFEVRHSADSGSCEHNDLWFCHLDVNWESNGYLVTVLAQTTSGDETPSSNRLVDISSSLIAFLSVAREVESQIRAEGMDSKSPAGGDGDEPIASFRRLTESPIWSLPQIEETVLRRIRSTMPNLNELHLFLKNPLDSHLYYAATDQLTITPPLEQDLGTAWKLSPLDEVYTRHVEDRLRELEQQTNRTAGTLVEFYRRIQKEGLPHTELSKHAGMLRLVLRCLPQELSCGVVGAAVREGILRIGGRDYWNPAQLKNRKKRPFFVQKLEVEKLFGVAKDGYLTAAPVFDAGQIIGGLFFVTQDRPNQEQMSVLLDGCLHASQLLAQYRTTNFTRSVIDTLEREPQDQFQTVVERHLGHLLLYGLLAVIDMSQAAPLVTHAWYRSSGAIQCELHDSQEVHQSRLLKSLVVRMKEQNAWLMDIDRDEWQKAPFRGNFPDARSCVLFPFDHETGFLFILAEPCERLLNSLSSLQQKLASLQTAVRLRDTYARRHEVQQFHSNATFSWHNLNRRFCRPLYVIYNRMSGRLSQMQDDGLPVNELGAYVKELGVIQEIMESQFLALKDSVDAHDSNGSNVESMDIHHVLDTQLRPYFALLLRTRDDEVADPYSGKVQLMIDCPRRVSVRGHVHAFTMAMLSLLENTLKDYAISKDLVANGDSARLQVHITVVLNETIVTIRVSDTGEGMDRKQCQTHNSRFQAIANGRLVGYQGFDKKLATSKGSGSQIGLLHAATVFAAIKSGDGKMRGMMRVEPHRPFGTCFVISLPAR